MTKILKHSSGTIEFMQTGNAFLISESKGVQKDIFIPRTKTGKAMNGDTVFVKLIKNIQRPGEYVGEVVGITKRFRTEYIGVLDRVEQKNIYIVKSFSKRFPIEFYIPDECLNDSKVGDKVIVKLTRWNKRLNKPVGVVKQVLGKAGDHNTEMNSIMFEYNIDSTFQESITKEAEEISFDIPQEEIAKREDLRGTTTLTIDPETAKDFDDALSYKKIDDDTYEVGVHIADVGHYIKPGSALDREAYKRATSTYLVDRCIPMLPERLSNGVCSLRPNEDKLAFSVIFTLKFSPKNPTIEEPIKLEVIGKRFVKTIINSGKRYSYEQAQEVIENGHVTGSERDKFDEAVLGLDVMAKFFRGGRFKKGAISFEKKEVKFKLDADGVPTGVYFKESKDSNKLIEEFMLLANQAVATFIGHDNKLPCIYRTHALPSQERLQELSVFVGQFGYKLEINESEEKNKENFNKLLADVKGSNHANIIETVAVRSMSKAIYSTEVLGHYGLGFRYYSHFTSPIRRYPDVILHRLLFDLLNKKVVNAPGQLQTQCQHCSELEGKAAKAERDSIKFKQVEYMQNHVGEEFEGVVSGVNNWGLFVEIKANGCDGLVYSDEMTSLGFVLDEKNYKFTNDNGKKIALGDIVKIKVNSVNLTKRQIEFSLLD
jgi:ribonuclease R